MNIIDKLTAELAAIHRRRKHREQAKKRDWERECAIEVQLHRERMKLLLNVEGGVRLRFRRREDDRVSLYNDSVGTLLEVNRTRCIVQFQHTSPCQYHHKWTLAIRDVQPASEQDQGFYLHV